MYGLDRLRDIRWLDYYLFGGVPATPEPMHGRRDHHHQAAIRYTGYSAGRRPAAPQEEGIITGYVEFDLDTGEFTIHCDDPGDAAEI